mgnify:FL=1
MRQPLILSDILGNTQKEHPCFPASKTALAKARRRHGLRALERHRVHSALLSLFRASHPREWCLPRRSRRSSGRSTSRRTPTSRACAWFSCSSGCVATSKTLWCLPGNWFARPACKRCQHAVQPSPATLPTPPGHSLSEWSLHQVARKATKGKANAAPDVDVEVGRHHSSFARVAGAVHHYAFLCNDSLWFCEVLRGNKYKVVHTFLFAAADTQSTPPQRAQDANDRPQATTDVQQSGQFSFWVSDSTLSVHLRFAGGEDADVWVQAIEEATGVNAHQEDGALETGVVADDVDVMSPAEEQPGQPAAEEEPQADASKSSSLDATSVPTGMPKPSARYITQYRARHNLGRSASQVSVSAGGRVPSVGGSGGALLTKV